MLSPRRCSPSANMKRVVKPRPCCTTTMPCWPSLMTSGSGHPQPCAAAVDGAALRVAERRKHAACPELTRGGPQTLVVLGSEAGGRWNAQARRFVRDLVRLKAYRPAGHPRGSHRGMGAALVEYAFYRSAAGSRWHGFGPRLATAAASGGRSRPAARRHLPPRCPEGRSCPCGLRTRAASVPGPDETSICRSKKRSKQKKTSGNHSTKNPYTFFAIFSRTSVDHKPAEEVAVTVGPIADAMRSTKRRSAAGVFLATVGLYLGNDEI